MKEKKSPSQKKRGATVAAVLCFVAAIAIVGTYTFNDYRKTQQDELARAEETNDTEDKAQEEPSQEANNLAVKEEEKTTQTDTEEKDDSDGAEGADGVGGSGIQTTAGSGHNINFNESSQLLWPVDGTVIMSYSMDKTVYFSTLDQYKYNPAMIISGAEGDQVISAAPGIVKSIDVTAQTGTTVNVDLGNGYELFYGQLKEVPVKVGDYVEAKTILGYVSQPTKYYSVEGCNVYFEMRKDGQPVNPVEYME
ncbi:MAG: peptidoglycan DD-metalloendopeptidase family protein [Dorea sp.]|uniref:murein hydrolase activator EnvC family protein n=1 Tax=Dorea sp. YH-dor226 TaxID=3151119 RepID=UPI00304A3A58|nr:peptidoglycan DD-metalloendopeptidase family protein [Dorea sp.]